MCLRKLNERTMEEEGQGWKVYLEMKDGNVLSARMFEQPLVGAWMLNQEPNLRYCCRLGYDHGFHLYKHREDAESQTLVLNEFLADMPNGYFVGATIKGERRRCPTSRIKYVYITRAYYRGYIAEDDKQVVARQLYVPIGDENPLLTEGVQDGSVKAGEVSNWAAKFTKLVSNYVNTLGG